jgi:hypothetical protein
VDSAATWASGSPVAVNQKRRSLKRKASGRRNSINHCQLQESMKGRNAMISKVKIGIIFGSAVVASAAIIAGFAHHHQVLAATTPIQPAPQFIPLPKPAAGLPLNAAPDSNGDNNPTDAVNDPNAPDPQSTDQAADSNQPATGDSTSSTNSDQEAIVAGLQQRAHHGVAVRPVAMARVVHVAQPVVADATASVDVPVMPVATVKAPALVVPSGTELTLRLEEPLGSKISQADQSFAGTLDRDIEVNGHTVIAAGARVTGKVVTARPAGRLAGEATLQLKITSVKVKSREIEVATEVRSFGPTIHGTNKVGRFMKGIAKRMDGQENDVLLAEQTAYSFNLSSPLQIR